MGPADRTPFGSAGGGGRTKSGSRRSTRAVYPASELSGEITLLLLLVWLYYLVFLLSRESVVFSGLRMNRSRLSEAPNRTEPPSTLRMGLLLYAKGVTDRWQHREGYKCKKRGGWYSYLYSAPYLTLTAGDKGIKCMCESPKQCRKGPLGAPPFATMAILSASHATAHR